MTKWLMALRLVHQVVLTIDCERPEGEGDGDGDGSTGGAPGPEPSVLVAAEPTTGKPKRRRGSLGFIEMLDSAGAV